MQTFLGLHLDLQDLQVQCGLELVHSFVSGNGSLLRINASKHIVFYLNILFYKDNVTKTLGHFYSNWKVYLFKQQPVLRTKFFKQSGSKIQGNTNNKLSEICAKQSLKLL